MIYKLTNFVVVVVVLLLISCTQEKQFPDFVSEKVEIENVSLNFQLPKFSNESVEKSAIKDLDRLMFFRNQFFEKDAEFDLDIFKSNWLQIQNDKSLKVTSSTELKLWFEITGLLLQLSGETIFADELEKLAFSGIGESRSENIKIVSPYVFSKNTDNLFVNLFTPASINYEHSTKGNVKVEMLTNYPVSGKINLMFGMSKRRFIELYIRIPYWADGATVEVKKVKYLAPAGGYCKIAKKWKEGDLVEINFPIENKPEYFR